MSKLNIKTSEWTKVGEIGVDAGLCWIGDPCYILHGDKDRLPKDIGTKWHDFCDKVHDTSNGATQFNYDAGHAGLGVCVSTGFGDGGYDVEVKYVRVKGWGKRIKEVRVVFIPDESLSEGEVLDPDDDSAERAHAKHMEDARAAAEAVDAMLAKCQQILEEEKSNNPT